MLSRRAFILSGAAVGGGLVVAYGLRSLDDGDAARKFAATGAPGVPLNAWLKITPAGKVICGIHRAEMGQGVTTTLAMLLAEELDADWADVRFEFVPVDRDYYNFGMLLRGQPLGDPDSGWGASTGTWAIRQVFHALGLSMTISSSSTVDAWDTLRPAGAAARAMLLQAAANRWDVEPTTLRTGRGQVIDPDTGRRLGYGELAEAAAREQPPADVGLKPADRYRLVGHNPPRLDTPSKTDGSAMFGLDVRFDDMLYAAIVHSPVAGTQVADFSAAAATDMPGVVTVVPAGTPGAERAVAVVADHSWHALRAACEVQVTPAEPASRVSTSSLETDYRARLDAGDASVFTDTSADDATPFETALAKDTVTTVTAEYSVPFLAHLCMEPMNCTARFDPAQQRLEIWAPTQAHSIARDVAAKLAGLEPDAVRVHTTFLGGGFGRRAEMDFVEQAVSVALAVPGRAVQVFWSREQDLRHDAFRPAASCRIVGGLDADGRLLGMDYTLVTQSVVASYETRTPTPRGGSAADDASVVEAVNPPVYPLTHRRLRFVPVELHVPAGYWRSVAHSWTTFFMESFVDEAATAAGIDGLTYRRELLSYRPRHLHVLDVLAAALTAEAEIEAPAGRGFSIAESHGTVVAHAVDVALAKGRFERVTRVLSVIDCGPVVHPDNVVAQVEGSVVDGLSAALYGRVEIDDGIVVEGNFDSYRRLRMADCPVIDVRVIASRESRPGGVGEPAVPGVAPALTNAIFAATGERIRALPLSR